ncbi:IclR family transcriptional regulator [Herbaspirillum sp. RTI4]|uniref:IclR family transcriptional regulator n=1 Tax=Herbaspirillum sp. RTI4 TaxID=3048640 RepID=UPI002AB45160|nr:IclR family transcriptional regulator [Herbaspirillum sp. RTI4]MDY7579752.1 IclR family transcriptional regulator [Herbaspirillum sp. RTI4]MEA9982726.1 IclR family transcriptional regulator [Herbaspirillum sp. RTI4]
MSDLISTRNKALVRRAAIRPVDVRIVLRAPRAPYREQASTDNGKLIAPIVRGFAVLDAFLEQDQWLANGDIAERTAIPKATVSRLTRTLTELGYLTHSDLLKKYRLASAVLDLGYAAMADTDVVSLARGLMQEFADVNGVYVALAGRDGLDMILFENCHSSSTLATIALGVGEHMPIAASPLGWALLAGLPNTERTYLLDRIRPHHKRDLWMLLRQRIDEAADQVAEKGYCSSTGDWGADITVVAAPLHIAGRLPMALVCAGSPRLTPQTRLDEQLGRKLVTLIHQLKKNAAVQA